MNQAINYGALFSPNILFLNSGPLARFITDESVHYNAQLIIAFNKPLRKLFLRKKNLNFL